MASTPNVLGQLNSTDQAVQVDVLDYKNPQLPVDERVAALLSVMTLEEKVAQMLCIWREKKAMLLSDDGTLDQRKLRQHLQRGIGQIARLSDTNGGLGAQEMAELANSLQRFLVEETRLGIPALFHEECLHGLAAQDATSYPQPIGLASTFNPQLIETMYSAIAEETRLRGAHHALTPVVDVARDPRWGRVEETFGEDPYLVAQMGIAAVRGFQGDGSFKDTRRVMATLKHLGAHSQPESGMNCGPGNISERVLRDVFLSPFREAIKKAGAASVMASYNEIDGVPSHANQWLLRDILRDEWGFTGIVVADYLGITELHRRDDVQSHCVASDKPEAAELAVRAGVNIEFPDQDCYPAIVDLVRDGRLSEAAINELIAPLLRYKFQLGLFEHPYVEVSRATHDALLERNRALALQTARETVVLLKNENHLLPLDKKKLKTVAVIGPNANRTMLGGYSGKPKYYTTVLEGIREAAGKDVKVLYGEGCKITVGGSWNEDTVTAPDPEADRALVAEAVALAQQSDIVVLVLGENEQTSREAWSKSHLGDRASLDLLGMQNELVRKTLLTGKPVVVVLFSGRPNSITEIAARVPAVLECWYLGQESGKAVADVLFGEYNPGGKLPISFPRSVGHIPVFYNHKPSSRRGYLFDDVSPLYAFGYGLSYASFKLSNLRLEREVINANEETTVKIDVENTGTRAGAEVVQMYIRDVVSSVTRPVKELKGFKKVQLQPKETTTVVFPITFEHLAFTNIDKRYTVEPGEFEIMVGNSSRDMDLTKVTLRVQAADGMSRRTTEG